MKRLIVLRHGYTFENNEEPRRVGSTDLPLVLRGRVKIQQVAKFISNYKIDKIISSGLKRTFESASIIKEIINFTEEIEVDDRFKEIDYGPDEDKLESEVIARLGSTALTQWDESNIVPSGWTLDVSSLKNIWIDLANLISEGQTILVVTSAGIARFSSSILPDCFNQSFKISPGHLSIFEYNNKWELKSWNYFPKEDFLLREVES